MLVAVTAMFLYSNLKFVIYFWKLNFLQSFAHGNTQPISASIQLSSIIESFTNCTTSLHVFNETKLLPIETILSIILFNNEKYQNNFQNISVLERCSQVSFQIGLEAMAGLDEYYYRDFLSVTLNAEESEEWIASSFKIHIFNRYYESKTQKWIPIKCSFYAESDCFLLIDSVTTSVSLLNKYFWDFSYWLCTSKEDLYNVMFNNNGIDRSGSQGHCKLY